MPPKRSKAASFSHPSLFELQAESDDSKREKPQRSNEIPGILLGTFSFTAKGWEGTFYPQGMRSHDFLGYYAKQFRTVEIDSTFYGTPKPSTVSNWKQRTPSDFVFVVKVPQIVTHDKILVGSEQDFREFLETISLLGGKLGPMLFQFLKFDKWVLKDSEAFLTRLDSFLKQFSSPAFRYAVEVRNKNWLDASLANFLRERNIALAFTDTTFVPRPWEMDRDLVTADFAYVRWLGNRKGIEETTTTWDKANH